MAKVLMDDSIIRWLHRGTPLDPAAMAQAAKHDGGLQGEGETNLQHLRLASNLVEGNRPDATTGGLLDFYARSRTGHRGEFEGLSVGYGHLQRVAALAVKRRAEHFNADAELTIAAREFLRWDLTIAALCCSDSRPRVIMPCGRALLPRDSDGWTATGAVNIETDYAVAAAAGIPWHPQPGTGKRYKLRVDPADDPEIREAQRAWAAYRAVVDRDVPGLFSAAEQTALRAWILEGALSPALASLIEPIRVLQGLHVLRGRGRGHIAWMTAIRSYGAGKNRTQPLVRSIGGEDRFIVTKPPSGAERIATGSWVVRGGGASRALGTASAGVGTETVEIVIDLDGGRIVGETAEPPALPVEPPPPAPPGDPALRLVRERLAELRATWDRQKKGKGKAADTERTLLAVEAAVEGL
jgi:hypothetical protein